MQKLSVDVSIVIMNNFKLIYLRYTACVCPIDQGGITSLLKQGYTISDNGVIEKG